MSPDAVKPAQILPLLYYSALKNRWPGGKKVIRYKQAQLERFATSKRLYGVVTRLIKYKDRGCECQRNTLFCLHVDVNVLCFTRKKGEFMSFWKIFLNRFGAVLQQERLPAALLMHSSDVLRFLRFSQCTNLFKVGL